jgi:hypothetical protein
MLLRRPLLLLAAIAVFLFTLSAAVMEEQSADSALSFLHFYSY